MNRYEAENPQETLEICRRLHKFHDGNEVPAILFRTVFQLPFGLPFLNLGLRMRMGH